jgi:hypothetical protein
LTRDSVVDSEIVEASNLVLLRPVAVVDPRVVPGESLPVGVLFRVRFIRVELGAVTRVTANQGFLRRFVKFQESRCGDVFTVE